jgi:hypothetical protein
MSASVGDYVTLGKQSMTNAGTVRAFDRRFHEETDMTREEFVHLAFADQLDLVDVFLRAIPDREAASDDLHGLNQAAHLKW